MVEHMLVDPHSWVNRHPKSYFFRISYNVVASFMQGWLFVICARLLRPRCTAHQNSKEPEKYRMDLCNANYCSRIAFF